MDPKETFINIVECLQSITEKTGNEVCDREELLQLLYDFKNWIQIGGFIPKDILSCLR